MFNDAEGEIYRLQEGNRELKAENKRLLEAFQRERDEKEACVRHSEKTIERLREALDAAEKVVQAARGDQFGLERRMEEYDKLKEVE